MDNTKCYECQGNIGEVSAHENLQSGKLLDTLKIYYLHITGNLTSDGLTSYIFLFSAHVRV